MSRRVLLVDDEENVLSGYRRQLHKQFDLVCATSGAEALEHLRRDRGFAVVVSDMRMPGMDGVALLREVRGVAPEAVRMMLTGNADLQTAVDAINAGSIYRFMTKPTSPQEMAAALEEGVREHLRRVHEREVLSGTVTGLVNVLSDIIGLMNPAAVARSNRLRLLVRHMAAEVSSAYLWENEMAATLSQIGRVSLPAELLSAINRDRPLLPAQKRLVQQHAAVGARLLAQIPRFELVARIVEMQNAPPEVRIDPEDIASDEDAVLFGAQMLRIALEMDEILAHNIPFIRALKLLHQRHGPDHPLVEALMGYQAED